MAIEQGAHLVPVVVLGEVQSLRNLIDLPDIQQWTYKKLGFPIPYLLVGRWGFSPLPRQTGLKFLIGRPISPPVYLPGDKVCPPQVSMQPSGSVWLIAFSTGGTSSQSVCHFVIRIVVRSPFSVQGRFGMFCRAVWNLFGT